MSERPSGRSGGRIVRAMAEENPDEIFISRRELVPHLQRAQVVLTRGGKLSAKGIRVGHLPIGAVDRISVPRDSMRLDGGLRMFGHTKHLEAYVRSAFDQAISDVVRDRSEEERRKHETADMSAGTEFRRAFSELRGIASGAWDKIASVMAGGGQIQENQSQE